jgi:hypothetical protein
MNEPRLDRIAFRTSRLLDFTSLRELTAQIGHPPADWPLVVVKELVDNALDACEEAAIAPAVAIEIAPGPERAEITVRDNGPGIATETVAGILDYGLRVSSREAYVSPTRGAQGNALKTILPMGYVLDRERQDGLNAEAVGETVIETRGLKHRIQFRVDHVNNEPRITDTTSPSPLSTGTRITVKWPVTPIYGSVTYLEYARDRFLELAEGYVWFNPHLSLRVRWHGKDVVKASASNPDWQKWRPRDPTSAHWYDETRLQRYLAAHVARDRDLKRDRPVRQFIAEFRGLSGTTKQRQVLAEVGCSHVSLRKFFGVDHVNRAGVGELLSSMKRHSKPVAASAAPNP